MKNKNYYAITLDILEEDLEIGYAILTDFPFIGMEELFDKIILYFEERDWNDAVKNNLENQLFANLPNSKISNIQIMPEQNWNEEWEKNVEPVIISDTLVITPQWKAYNFDVKNKIIINPKMSFGTGQHSTTKQMAIMIENFFTKKKKKNIWIDAGTGTGVLAIISAKLGAKKIYAFDNDEWAIENAIENVELNSVQDKIKIIHSGIDDYDFPKADCITANMFLGLIIRSFKKFYNSLKMSYGTLFISGILLFDRDELLKSAIENGFDLVEERQELEWCCFEFKVKQ